MARLIDSSLWVDFTRRKSPRDLKVRIQSWILDPAAALCEPIAFEVLRHASADERPLIEAQFATLPLLSSPPALWRAGSRLGQQCCEDGFTAGSMDLLIAVVAIHHEAELVTFDGDYLCIARSAPLKVRLLERSVESE